MEIALILFFVVIGLLFTVFRAQTFAFWELTVRPVLVRFWEKLKRE